MSADPLQSHPAGRLGATLRTDGRCEFLVWAPLVNKVEVRLLPVLSAAEGPPEDAEKGAGRLVALEPQERGYHRAVVSDVAAGQRYLLRLGGGAERPDPASRFQPLGVHGPSEVLGSDHTWHDSSWRGVPLESYVLYELHVGTFTPEGTFDAVIPRLDALKELGVTAVELMPVAQFPGGRNWGYDGVQPFAVQNSYGGPAGLRRLVEACHQRGLAVVLDVVYNHLGPEGNYLAEFGPYFTDRYHTPWGAAINYDGPGSDEVRRFFIENALYWVDDFHFDALRLDAIHGIVDPSAYPFLEELGVAVHARAESAAGGQRKVYVIPESDLNDARLIRPRGAGGYGLDAQWSDDFHHALHVLLTGERAGYYQDFGPSTFARDGERESNRGVARLARAFTDGFVYSGQYSAFRGRRHGNSSRDLAASCFVVFAQNHDQVGNRMLGDRLSGLVSFDAQKLAAGAVLLSPFLPLLFMGEEYGESAPFQYFVSHSDAELIEAVRKGRREEFAAFGWKGEVPDPQDEATFLRSKLHWELRGKDQHRTLLEFHRELLRLRKEIPALARRSKEEMEVTPLGEENILLIRRGKSPSEALVVFHFGKKPVKRALPVPAGSWKKQLDSADPQWCGKGASLPDVLVGPARPLPGGADSATVTLPAESFALYLSSEPRR